MGRGPDWAAGPGGGAGLSQGWTALGPGAASRGAWPAVGRGSRAGTGGAGLRAPAGGACSRAARAQPPAGSSTRDPVRGGGSGRAGGLRPPGRALAPLNSQSLGRGSQQWRLRSGLGSVRGAWAGGQRRRRIAGRAAAWARRAMAAPEPAPRRGREREREEESEDESDILEESPCGRWQKRREQVGTTGAGRGVAGGAGDPKPLRSLEGATPFVHPFGLGPRPGEEPRSLRASLAEPLPQAPGTSHQPPTTCSAP